MNLRPKCESALIGDGFIRLGMGQICRKFSPGLLLVSPPVCIFSTTCELETILRFGNVLILRFGNRFDLAVRRKRVVLKAKLNPFFDLNPGR